MVAQIRRAALSAHLNLAEAASRRSSAERRRYYEVARGSLIEVDAALDVAHDLGYVQAEDFQDLEKLLVQCFKILCGLIASEA